MGAVIALDYAAMRNAYKQANKAAEECESYANKINAKVTQKIGSLRLGGSRNTSQADYFARAKINSLNQRKEKCRAMARKMEDARGFAQQTDGNVSAQIRRSSDIFRSTHDMKVNVVTEFFTWITTTVVNATEFGRIINQIFKEAGSWIDSAKRGFKDWYELGNGKYIIKAALAAAGTVIAVAFLVCVAWPALVSAIAGGLSWALVTAAAAVVSAVIAVANSVVKTINGVAAAVSFEDDPGWAKRYSSFTTLAGYLRDHNFKSSFINKISGTLANLIDMVEIAASIIDFAGMVHNGVNVVKRIKSVGIDKVFNKVHFRSPSGKMTVGTVKYGIKNIIRNGAEMKKMMTTTDLTRLQSFHKKSLEASGFYKVLESGKNFGERVEMIGDKGLRGLAEKKIKGKIKEKIIKNSTLHVFGSKSFTLYGKTRDFFKAQKPKYSINV